MQENHKPIYSYSYKIYQNNSDNSNAQKIDLPDNVTAADFITILKRNNLTNAGKIQITRVNRTDNTIKETITMYIDDRVKTAGEIQDILKRKYGCVCGFSPSIKTTAPTVITGHTLRRRYGMTGGYNVRIDRNTVIYKEPKEETWTEDHAVVETLDPGRDVLVNRESNQIWPDKTGTVPKIVQDFFINER